jgi:hypothetical protein
MANDEEDARTHLKSVLAEHGIEVNDALQPYDLLELNISLPFARLISKLGIPSW